MKISTRLSLGFGLVLSLLVLLSAISIFEVNGIQANLKTVNDVNSVKQRYAINFRGSVHDRAISLRDVTLVAPAQIDAEVATIQTLANHYAQSAAPLDAMMTEATAEEKRILTAIKATEARTLPMIQSVIDLQRAGQFDEARGVLMGEARPQFVQWLGEINQFIDFQEAANQAVGTQTRKTAEQFLWLTLALCAGALGLGGLIAVGSVRSLKPLNELTKIMARMASHDYEVKVPHAKRQDEVGAIARAVEVFKTNGAERSRLQAEAKDFQAELDNRLKAMQADHLAVGQEQKRVVEAMARQLSRLADGDLCARLDDKVAQEYQPLKDDFNRAVSQLEKTMQSMSDLVANLRSGVGEIRVASSDLSGRTETQAATVEQTAVQLNQITAAVHASARGAEETSQATDSATAEARRSGEIVAQAVQAMDQIQQSSTQINQIISVIDEIAFQTNLLALNAGVEAARAGEAGRGFAVVASEVRALAQRSAEAAKEIKTLISASGHQVEAGVKLVSQTGTALERIIGQVEQINTVVMKIATSSRDQSQSLAEVNTAVSRMDQATQQNAAMVEETTAATHNLDREASDLLSMIQNFRMGSGQGTGERSARVSNGSPVSDLQAQLKDRLNSEPLALSA